MKPFLCSIAVAALIASNAVAQTPTHNDVQYGLGPRDAGGFIPLTMDLYLPSSAPGPTPVVLWIHGGGWSGGSNEPAPGFTTQLLNRGIALASIKYRLTGDAIAPAQIHDAKGAVRFLRANASTYNIDPLRFGAWGSSAGGHLAALLATSGGVAAAEGNIGGNLTQSSRILAAVEYFGPTDILNMNLDVTNPPGSTIDHDAPNSPESRLIGFSGPGQGIGVLRANQTNPNPPYPEKMALVNLMNPITHVTFNDPDMYIAHGTADTLVPIRQSEKLYNALQTAGVASSYTAVVGAGHGNLGSAPLENAMDLFESVLFRKVGDATLDGIVNLDDFNRLAANFGQIGGWRQGDFNNDGQVNLGDFDLLAAHFGAASGMAGALPEPGMSLLGLAAWVLARRAR
jgi:acetyl esterase/lipase